MAVKLTGYSNSRQINQDSMLKQGLDNLRNAGREKAREHLTDLRRDLQTKSGVVRLLHTTKTNKDMKFKNAWGLKRLFLSGEKLRRSGDVIKDLLKNAGLSEAKVQEFGQYATARGDRGVQAQKVLQYIDALQADKGNSELDALRNFGVSGVSRKLGQGGFGQVYRMIYRGEEHAYKMAIKNGRIGKLGLVDEAGQEIQPQPREESRSMVTFEESANSPGKSNDFLNLGDRSNAALDDHYLDNFNHQSFRSESKSGKSSQNLDPNSPKLDQAQKSQQLLAPIIEEDPAADLAHEPMPPPEEKQKLARTGLANAARVKDLPQVITPSVFVVKEGRSDGSEVFHAVAGQRTLKDWAKRQDKGSSFDVVGLLMPKAAGKNPVEEDSKGAFKVNVSRSDLKPMAESAMRLLKGMAKHGFIHGDIKPANLMWDAKSKNLQLIDNDNLVKVSKDKGSTVPQGLGHLSLGYLHPLAMHKDFLDRKGNPSLAQLGLGRDLYATGLVLLEASLLAGQGGAEQANTILNEVRHRDLRQNRVWKLLRDKPIADRIDYLKRLNFEARSVQDFARTCLIKALEFEQERIERKDFGFDRTEIGREADLLRELEDELKQVK